ncbi:nucleophosmin-like [Aedes aegypti]|uniref:Uncharacterized protein n=1 Tax=Aedes aegypti TaxID=7159 RepID=A0A6I8U2A7_AEDAE|nr:nucleophosmin-like [Aedes aegypti]
MEKSLPVYITVDGHRSYVSYPKEQQRTSSSAIEKQAEPHAPSSEQKSNEKRCAPPPAHSESSEDDTGDDDDDDDDGDDNDDDNRNETTVEPSGKRRLSTETSHSGTTVENEPKRSCSQNGQTADKRNNSDWKVYQTRSRRKNESEPK